MNNNITITDTELLVDGKPVANVTDYDRLRNALLDKLTRREAVYFTVAMLGEARTTEVSRALNMDKGNTSKRLEELAEEGRLKVVTRSHHTGGKGRPSRVWAVK